MSEKQHQASKKRPELNFDIQKGLKVSQRVLESISEGIQIEFDLAETYSKQTNDWTVGWEIYVDGSAYFG